MNNLAYYQILPHTQYQLVKKESPILVTSTIPKIFESVKEDYKVNTIFLLRKAIENQLEKDSDFHKWLKTNFQYLMYGDCIYQALHFKVLLNKKAEADNITWKPEAAFTKGQLGTGSTYGLFIQEEVDKKQVFVVMDPSQKVCITVLDTLPFWINSQKQLAMLLSKEKKVVTHLKDDGGLCVFDLASPVDESNLWAECSVTRLHNETYQKMGKLEVIVKYTAQILLLKKEGESQELKLSLDGLQQVKDFLAKVQQAKESSKAEVKQITGLLDDLEYIIKSIPNK